MAAPPLPHNLFESCVCCNNPWSRGSDDAFAFICGACPEPIDPSFDINNFDHSTDPSDNFFQYANGGWMKANPIPAEYPNWNTFLALHVQNQERLKTTLQELQELAKSGDAASADPEHLKLAIFYSAAMDETAVEAAGVAPLAPMLALCEAAKEPAARVESIAKLYATFGTTSFFDVDASPDDKNSSHTIAQLSQGGLGLLDRDYYTDEDKAEKREVYVQHITKVLLLLECGYDDATAAAAAGLIMALETNLAESHMTKIENRDPEATYNLKTLEEVDAYGFDFSQWFTLIGKAASDVGSINVRNTGALECAASTIMGADPETIEHYLRWRVAKTWSSYLPAAFVDAEFEFYSKTLQGQKEQKPRWKRAMAQTESALGEAIGKIYCEKYFDSSSKAKALEIVESVRDALKQRLGEVDWMKSDETRDAALAKMAAFKIKLGFPDEWIDYSTFTPLSTDSFVECGCKATAFLIERELKEMNAPTDRVKWLMTPQTINAYYHPSLNEIVFPAAILQPPFFNPEADAAVNYGAMGAIVGHEMTHGFDDQGRKYNHEGNMVDWWTEADGAEYERRVEVMVSQASEFEVFGTKLQGKLCCGENIADLGGLRLAYRALCATEGFDDTELIGGFTPTQRFFLAWAVAWRENVSKERALQLVTLDPHGPNAFRCNGPLSNIPEFIEAFGIPDDGTSVMGKVAEKRVDIW